MDTSTLTEKQQYWLSHLHAADSFNGTLKEYAQKYTLAPQDLYSWRSQLRKKGVIKPPANAKCQKKPTFSKVETSTSQSSTHYQCRMGPIVITGSRLPDPHWLATLAHELEGNQ